MLQREPPQWGPWWKGEVTGRAQEGGVGGGGRLGCHLLQGVSRAASAHGPGQELASGSASWRLLGTQWLSRAASVGCLGPSTVLPTLMKVGPEEGGRADSGCHLTCLCLAWDAGSAVTGRQPARSRARESLFVLQDAYSFMDSLLCSLRLFQKFDTFRILVCGGDGSVGWVLSEIDSLNLHKQVLGYEGSC